MASKLAAAKIADLVRCPDLRGLPTPAAPVSWQAALADEAGVGTVFRARASRLSARKLWIAFALGSSGGLTVDEGARVALTGRGRSPWPAGVTGATVPSGLRMRWRSPVLTERSSPRAWSGCTQNGPLSGWGGAVRLSFISRFERSETTRILQFGDISRNGRSHALFRPGAYGHFHQ